MKTKLLIFASLLLSLVFSCKRKDVSSCENCQNGSYCKDDTCRCLTGYEGTHCETKSSAKFLGNYTVTDSGSFSWTSCVSGAQFQTVAINRTHMSTIFEDVDAGEIIITNYFGDGGSTVAQVKNSDLTITGELKFTYGPNPDSSYTTDICFLNKLSWPTGTLTTSSDSIGTDSTGAIITGNFTRITIDMHGYCVKDMGSCGVEVKETICKSVFVKEDD